jgi:hypothetical protein
MQQIGFLLQNLLFAQHVSSTIMRSTPDQRPVNQKAKYHRQQPSV